MFLGTGGHLRQWDPEQDPQPSSSSSLPPKDNWFPLVLRACCSRLAPFEIGYETVDQCICETEEKKAATLRSSSWIHRLKDTWVCFLSFTGETPSVCSNITSSLLLGEVCVLTPSTGDLLLTYPNTFLQINIWKYMKMYQHGCSLFGLTDHFTGF